MCCVGGSRCSFTRSSAERAVWDVARQTGTQQAKGRPTGTASVFTLSRFQQGVNCPVFSGHPQKDGLQDWDLKMLSRQMLWHRSQAEERPCRGLRLVGNCGRLQSCLGPDGRQKGWGWVDSLELFALSSLRTWKDFGCRGVALPQAAGSGGRARERENEAGKEQE